VALIAGEELARIARATFDSARDHFDAAPLRFWDRYGARTVARARLAAGARVLDVCSGTGASALAASRAVGPAGRVDALDISASLLEIAARKAEREGLGNVAFHVGDMARLPFEEGSFDAVVVVFGIFFAPDMGAQLRALARTLRPGGTIAITTWGPRLFAPLYPALLDEVGRRRPGLDPFRPWDRLTAPDDLSALLASADLDRVRVEVEAGEERLEHPADWWSIVLGTGLRWCVDQLDRAEAAEVRERMIARARSVRAIETNVIYGTATKK
jgi:SAM-dependent methyltransferase